MRNTAFRPEQDSGQYDSLREVNIMTHEHRPVYKTGRSTCHRLGRPMFRRHMLDPMGVVHVPCEGADRVVQSIY